MDIAHFAIIMGVGEIQSITQLCETDYFLFRTSLVIPNAIFFLTEYWLLEMWCHCYHCCLYGVVSLTPSLGPLRAPLTMAQFSPKPDGTNAPRPRCSNPQTPPPPFPGSPSSHINKELASAPRHQDQQRWSCIPILLFTVLSLWPVVNGGGF